MYEIEIEKNGEAQRVSISGNIIFNNNIVDVAKIDNIGVIYSYTINLDRNKETLKLFDFLGANGSISEYPYQNTECKILLNGFPIMPRAFIVYFGVTPKYYEIIINSGNYNYFKSLEKIKITELDAFKNYNLFTLNSIDNINWVLMDLGDSVKTSPVKISNLRPVVRFNEIFDDLTVLTGFTYEMPDNVLNELDKYAFPLLNDKASNLVRTRAEIYYYSSFLTFPAGTGNLYGIIPSKITDYYNLLFTDTRRAVSTSIYKCPTNTNLTIDIKGNIGGSNSHGVTIYKNNQYLGALQSPNNEIILNIHCNKNDEIIIYFEKMGVDVASTLESFQYYIKELDFEYVDEKLEIPTPENMPDILVSEFIKTFMQIFALYVNIDYVYKKIKFFNIDSIQKNLQSGNFYYFDNSIFEINSIKYKIGDFKNINTFNYIENTDESLNKDYAKYDFIINYLSGVQDFNIINFPPTYSSYLYGGDFCKIKKYALDEDGILQNNYNLAKRIIKIRENASNLTIKNQAGATKILYGFLCGGFEDLRFKNLIPSFWSSFISTFEKPEIYQLKIRMDLFTFMNFDFSKPVLFDNINGTFFVLSINEFNPIQKTCIITTIKLR